jgi:MinD superfamily P-loop ATPase
MKEIVVISGKGGTGKTSIAASFSYLGGNDIIVADCDVDAADLHLLLQPNFGRAEDFYSGLLAKIDYDKCTNCGECAEVCRFGAFTDKNDQFMIDALDCEGCGYCQKVCSFEAITMEEQNVGKIFISLTKLGSLMVHARLGIGAENSGKLVAKVKSEAKKAAWETDKEIVLVDGSPGIGCPVISSLSGADYVVLVSEPTISGLHDLKRIYELVKKFNIDCGCIINKFDLNTNVCMKIINFLKENHIKHISSLPYDEVFTEAMTNGETIIEYSENQLKDSLEQSWDSIKELIYTKGIIQ